LIPKPRGHRLVIVRHAGREARLEDDREAFCISFRASDTAATMSGLVDRDRRDAFTVKEPVEERRRLFRCTVHAAWMTSVAGMANRGLPYSPAVRHEFQAASCSDSVVLKPAAWCKK
jgi:hypothetical protein